MSPLRWTCKSARTIAAELMHQGHAVSHQTVSEVPQQLGYSLQANRKARKQTGHRIVMNSLSTSPGTPRRSNNAASQ